jgi:tetratricopeptide (TPR) repeat protein
VFSKRLIMSAQNKTASAPFMAGEPIKAFVGRDKDLKDLHKIMVNRKVGAITGAGGIGKTELARVYANRYRAAYPAGVFWASLKGSTWQQEAQRILKELHPEAEIVPLFDNAKAKDEILRHLNRKEALLVIDNVNEAGEIIRPDCSVLVTTKERKAFGVISRIAIKELDGLSGAEGIKLLAKVLGKDRVAQDSSGALRIVDILDGMPLALQIAAYHLEAVPDLSFSNYVGQTQGKIKELKLKDSEDKAVVASLEISLRQLESLPQGARLAALFGAASICAESGFTSLTLAETVGLSEVGQKTAETLHRRSLLEFDQVTSRYNMHPLLRRLSAAKVKKDEVRELFYRENHSMHFLRFAQEHGTNPDILIAERDSLWQAMVQTRHIGRENELLPKFLEHLIQPFQQRVASKDYEGAFRYLVATNLINMNNLGLATNLGSILEILAKNQASLQEASRAWVYTTLGNLYIRLGEYAKALGFYEKALKTYDLIGDASGQGKVLGNMGDVALRMDDGNKAMVFYDKSLKVYRQIGDAWGQAKILGNMGIACADRGEHSKSISYYEKQLEISRLTSDPRSECNAFGNLGLAYVYLGKYSRSIGFYKKQLEIARQATDARAEGNALGNIGIAYASLGEHAKAIDFYKKQLEIHHRIGYVLGEGNALANMGMAYAKIGMHEEAHRCLDAGSSIFRGLGLKHEVAQIEEMKRNAEHWIMRSVGVGQEKLTSATSPDKKTFKKKLKP